MVKQVMLIGFIGLLIALSNASTEAATEHKDFQYKANDDKLANVVQALILTAGDDFNLKKALFTPAGVTKSEAFCPKGYSFCKGNIDACVETKEKSINLKFESDEAATKVDNQFAKENKLSCEDVDATHSMEKTLFEFMGNHVFDKDGVPDKKTKDLHCIATFEKKTGDSDDKSMHFIVQTPSEEVLKNDAAKAKEFKNQKTSLNKINFSNVEIGAKKFKSIKCVGFSTTNWTLWIIFAIVVVVVVGGVAYWYFFYGDDEDDEGTCRGANSAVNP